MNSEPMKAVSDDSMASDSGGFTPVVVEPELVNSDIIDTSDGDDIEDVDFEDSKSPSLSRSSASSIKNLDSRRRLEDKLEELRLRRETREFDFDL